MQLQFHLLRADFCRTRYNFAVGAHLDLAFDGAGHGWVQDFEAVGSDPCDGQVGSRADCHFTGGGIDVGDVAWLAVGGRLLDVEALALADGELVDALVFLQDVALLILDQARSQTDVLAQERLGVAVRNEADVIGIRLLCHGKSVPSGLFPNLRLRGVSYREHAVVEFLAGQHAEDVGLVLLRVVAAAQVAIDDLGVVAGGYGIEAERHGSFKQRTEFDLLVAAQARVWGFAAFVGVDKVIDDVFLEAVREIPYIKRDAELVADPARVRGILQGAAAASGFAHGLWIARKRKMHTHHIMAGLHRAGCRHRTIDATTHCCKYSHVFPFQVD